MTYKALITQNKSFGSLWLGQALFLLGIGFYVLCAVSLLFDKTQSVLWTTLFPILRFSISWTTGMIAPLIIQKIPLRQFLILVHTLLATLLVGMALYLHLCDEIHISVLLSFVAIISLLESWATPSRSALLPRIVAKEGLIPANSLIGTSNTLALCIGFLCGGWILDLVGIINLSWAAPILTLLGASLFLCIRENPSNTSANQKPEETGKWQILKETGTFVFKHPLYRRLFTLETIEYIAGSAWAGSIMLAFIKEVLHKSDAWWGYIHGSYLFGTVLGGLIAILFTQWLKRKLKWAFIIGSANLGVLTFIFAISPNPWVSITLAILMGIPYQMRDIALQTMLQTNAETNKLPQIFAAHHVVTSLSIVIGIILMGVIANYAGSQMALLFSGVLVLCSAMMARGLPKEK